jgi:tetratricopeptide (TPR) repeat protein
MFRFPDVQMSRSGNILFTPASQSMPPKPFKYAAFLSHNGAQKDWTENLARRLRDDGFKVWFDKWVLPQYAGNNWIGELRKGVEASRKIILVWSPDFFTHDWPQFESTIIQSLDPIGKMERVIPLLHTASKIPTDWGFRQALDFRSAAPGTMEFDFHYHQLVHNLDNSKPYEGDFERFKKINAGNIAPTSIPPVRPLPAGSRMPQASNPLFVGREEEMRTLKQSLTPGSNALVGVHAAVVGMGGVGKTQLAIEFAHHYGQDYPGGVFWLNFAGEEDPINEVARCGGPEGMDLEKWSEMKAPEQSSRVHKHWEENEHASLLIFDNAEDPAAVEKWRPKHGHGSVLITSRRDDWPPKMGVKPLGIETLPRQKSLDLLAEVRPIIASNSKERDAADKICDCLGDLPLALTVAAFYLRKYKSESLAEYLKALSAQPAIQDSSLEKVALSFAVSYNKLKPENATDALAQKLFHLASWFAPVSINRDLLIASAGVDATDRKACHAAEDALGRLRDLGLIKEEPNGRLLLHRLLRDFARLNPHERLDQEKALQAVGESLFEFASQENNSGLPQALARERVHLREVAAEIELVDAESAANLYAQLGRNGRALALFQEAKEYYERALKLDESVYGLDHPNVAIDLNNLGLVLRNLGDFIGARVNYDRALKIGETVFGLNHYHVATYVNNLGLVLQDLGDLAGARANIERALKIGEAIHGPEHPTVAIRINNLGSVLQDLGDLAGARANYERALRIDESVYGSNHPEIAIDVSNLGSVLQDLGDLNGARTNFERALKIDESVYGPDHPDIATDVSNLGSVLQNLRDLAGARACYEWALKIRKKFLGEDHPHTKIAQSNLNVLTEEENEQKNTG